MSPTFNPSAETKTRPTRVELADLQRSVRAYLSEYDNPVPDAVYRRMLRDHLRRMVGAPPEVDRR